MKPLTWLLVLVSCIHGSRQNQKTTLVLLEVFSSLNSDGEGPFRKKVRLGLKHQKDKEAVRVRNGSGWHSSNLADPPAPICLPWFPGLKISVMSTLMVLHYRLLLLSVVNLHASGWAACWSITIGWHGLITEDDNSGICRFQHHQEGLQLSCWSSSC